MSEHMEAIILAAVATMLLMRLFDDSTPKQKHRQPWPWWLSTIAIAGMLLFGVAGAFLSNEMGWTP